MKIFLIFGLAFIVTACGIQSIPKSKNEVEASWAEVLNQYKRRADLVPNLVQTVKAYAKHEKDTLQAVVEARAKASSMNIDVSKLNEQNMQMFQKAQGSLSSALSRLMVVVEKYPQLRASENFQALQAQLEGTENRITIARRRYIEAIKQFNNLVTVPPSSWTNSLFYHHVKMPQFSVENETDLKKAPEVKF